MGRGSLPRGGLGGERLPGGGLLPRCGDALLRQGPRALGRRLQRLPREGRLHAVPEPALCGEGHALRGISLGGVPLRLNGVALLLRHGRTRRALGSGHPGLDGRALPRRDLTCGVLLRGNPLPGTRGHGTRRYGSSRYRTRRYRTHAARHPLVQNPCGAAPAAPGACTAAPWPCCGTTARRRRPVGALVGCGCGGV